MNYYHTINNYLSQEKKSGLLCSFLNRNTGLIVEENDEFTAYRMYKSPDWLLVYGYITQTNVNVITVADVFNIDRGFEVLVTEFETYNWPDKMKCLSAEPVSEDKIKTAVLAFYTLSKSLENYLPIPSWCINPKYILDETFFLTRNKAGLSSTSIEGYFNIIAHKNSFKVI